ncbi:MAG TPA: cytochrome c [Thiolinea sp.]|nr:cytochrome c [Thiolinea sp.]
MQMLNSFSSLLGLLVVSLLITACGDKTATDQTANTEAKPAAQTSTSSAVGLDAHPGKALHDANCISCHDAKVYTRSERKVLDYTQLAAQVKRCDANLGSRLFDEDLAQITDYLNQAYYKYPKQ